MNDGIMLRCVRFCALTVLLSVFFATSNRVVAADEGEPCEKELLSSAPGANQTMSRFSSFGESYTLADLPDLVRKYPSIVMNAAQLYYRSLIRFPIREIRDPSYRVLRYREYSVFSDGIPEAQGARVIGQHDALDSFADWLKSRAAGDGSSKMFTFLGPAGTGKTLVLNILDLVNSSLASSTDPQFTFEFTNLETVPGLRPLVGDADDSGFSLLRHISANNSPIVLLPPSMQKRLTEIGSPLVEKEIGFRATPFLTPSPQTDEVLKYIVAYEMKKRGIASRAPTEAEYLEMISPYVRVIRRDFNTNQPTVIVRAQGKNPELSQLLISENLALSSIYTPASPFSYYYNGEVLRSQNGGLLLDEFQRQDDGFKNTFLDIAQNSVVSYGGAPPFRLNVVPVLADNDESVEAALESSPAFAQIDRTKPKPMRSLRDPQYIMKLAIQMIKPSQFVYRENTAPEDETKPFDMNVVFPNAGPDGSLEFPDGKYSIYYSPSSQTKILIAPRSLMLMALTLAATRLETNSKKIEKFIGELPTYQQYPHYFNDEMARLRIMLGKEIPEMPVLADLTTLRRVLNEGQYGITTRDAENWIKETIKMARDNNVPVTPAIVDLAFKTLIQDKEIKFAKGESKNARERWLSIHQRVKAEFILPMLTDDVSSVISGETGRVERMYDEIRSELLALDSDRRAEYYYPGGEKTPIARDRLAEIERTFLQMHGRALGAGLLKNFHVDVTVSEKRYQPLMDTIARYLMQKELDVTLLSEVANYFRGKTVSERGRQMGMKAESNLARYGYDKESFLYALLFVRDQQAELKSQLNAGQ